jgi:hypothetical protein
MYLSQAAAKAAQVRRWPHKKMHILHNYSAHCAFFARYNLVNLKFIHILTQAEAGRRRWRKFRFITF